MTSNLNMNSNFCTEYYSCAGATELSEFESRPSVISLNPSSLNTLIYGIDSSRAQAKQTPKQVFNAATFQIKRRKSSARELNSVSLTSVNRRLSSMIDSNYIENYMGTSHKSSLASRRLSRSLTRNVENVNLSKKSNFSRNNIKNKNMASTTNSTNNIKRTLSLKKKNPSLVASECTNWFYLMAILFIVFIVSLLFILVIFLICYNKFNRICYSLY